MVLEKDTYASPQHQQSIDSQCGPGFTRVVYTKQLAWDCENANKRQYTLKQKWASGHGACMCKKCFPTSSCSTRPSWVKSIDDSLCSSEQSTCRDQPDNCKAFIGVKLMCCTSSKCQTVKVCS